jgi:hypothetical protein
MPPKKTYKKVRKDKKQDKRIKSLEKFVYKTIENKQVNYGNPGGNDISTAGYVASQFLTLDTGAEDGVELGDAARIGNSISLMRQTVDCYLVQSTTDSFNRMRMLIVEALDGNEPLALSDVLFYNNYTTSGNLVFSSPYTTKTNTNRRYKIHMDKSFELNNNANGATRKIKHVIKYRENGSPGKVVEYSGPGSVPATNHRLCIMWISDSVSTTHPQVHYNVRSTFKDA